MLPVISPEMLRGTLELLVYGVTLLSVVCRCLTARA